MSHENEKDLVDRVPSSDGDDELQLSSQPKEVRTALRALAERRALLKDEQWRSLARGTSSKEDVAVLQEKAKHSPHAQALLDIAVPKENVRNLPRKRTIRQGAIAALLVAAGVTAVWMGKTRNPESAPTSALSMPAYVLDVHGGAAKTLGAENETSKRPVFTLSTGTKSILEINLSPPPPMLVARFGTLRAQAFLMRFGTITPLALPITVDPSGKVFVKGNREELLSGVPNGDYELWIAIGRESDMPAQPETIFEHSQKKDRALSLSRIRLHLDGESSNAHESTPLEVSYSGCAEIVAPVDIEPAVSECHIEGAGKIRLWVKAADGAVLTGRAVDRDLAGELLGATTNAGAVVEVNVPVPSGDIQIEANVGNRRSVFRLPLRPVKLVPAYDKAVALAKSGNRKEAFDAAQELTRDPDPGIRARAFGLMGRIDNQEGRIEQSKEGEKTFDGALVNLQKALEQDRQSGRLSAELDDGVTLSWVQVFKRHDLKGGQAALDALLPIMSQVPESVAKLPYYGANVSMQRGDLRTTLRLYDRTLQVARERGFEGSQSDTKFALADIFVKLGRIDDARRLRGEILQSLDEKVGRTCELAEAENQAGWVEYLAALSPKGGQTELADAKTFLERGLARACDDGFLQATIRTNLALVALAQGKLAEVRMQIAAARKDSDNPGPFLKNWWDLAESRVLIEEGRDDRSKAKMALANLESLLRRTQEAEVRFDAWLARAEALDVLEDPAARQAYAEADVDALRYAMGVEFTTGVGAFLAAHGRSTELRIDYLLRVAEKDPRKAEGALREAAEAARRSRTRVLASLPGQMLVGDLTTTKRGKLTNALDAFNRTLGEENGDAEKQRILQRDVNHALNKLLGSIGLSLEAPLSSPAKGELLLVYHPIGKGYVGFAIDDQARITAKRLDVGTIEKLTEREISALVLEPFRAQIEVAKRIRFAPYGPLLARLNFHALPWGDGTLVAAMPVAYAVDLGLTKNDDVPGRKEERTTAVVVMSDPLQQLPGAKREAKDVATVLQEKLHYDVKKPTTATFDEVNAFRSELTRSDVRVFHFVGHGQFSNLKTDQGLIYRPDLDGWESGLRLGNGTLFSARQVLGLDHIPPFVILSACEVGSLIDNEDGASLGLAQAFIIKGAHAVVAATVPVDAGTDKKIGLHERLMKRMYESASFPEDLPAALRDAQMQLQLEDDLDDWGAAFRVFVP